MITPNKTTPFKESITYKMTYILDENFEQLALIDIYKNTKNKFDDIAEFILAIDVLYILDKIDIDKNTGNIIKC